MENPAQNQVHLFSRFLKRDSSIFFFFFPLFFIFFSQFSPENAVSISRLGRLESGGFVLWVGKGGRGRRGEGQEELKWVGFVSQHPGGST